METTFFKRTGTLLLAGLLAATGCSSSSTKEATVPGSLSGTVTGASSAAVAGVVVTTNPAKVPATTTDSSGKYSLDLPPGDYTVSFAADNYEPASASATVSAGASTTLDQALTASTLVVSVAVPAALKNGGPAGFNTSVSGITATAKLAGSDVTSGSTITWTVKDYYGLTDPPGGATASPATGATTGFSIADFESLRQAANDWLNKRYGLAATADKSDFQGYVQAPERNQLLSFGVQQLRAMSFKVIATVKNGSRTSTGSAIIAPATITNGGNTLPVGMMVVANAPCAADSTGACTTPYAWTLKYMSASETTDTWTAPPDGVTLQGADTKNPYLLPTAAGVYALANGDQTPLYFRVSTFHGAPSDSSTEAADGIACNTCHKPTPFGDFSLTSKFAAWGSSAHGNFNWTDPTATPMSLFQFGVDGGEGPHYSESCISCHVVGYSKVPTAVNNGFDDRMAADSWAFPTVPATLTEPGNFAAMPADLRAMGAIQCENCHGPLEPTEHSQPVELNRSLEDKGLSPVASMNAGVCIVCHDALGNHDKGPLWATSPHANTQLALDEATVEGRGTGVEHCGRCHAGEGFVEYLKQQQSATTQFAGVIQRPSTVPALSASATCTPDTTNFASNADPNCACASTADVTAAGLPALPTATPQPCYDDTPFYNYLKGLNLTKAGVHSQTCQTCHDPHTTTLRVDGDTNVTAGSFRLTNAGAGALCMVCHNSRAADSTGSAAGLPVVRQNGMTLPDWTSPHTACQGDMFAGRNAFFMPAISNTSTPTDLPYLAKHATYLVDTCAGCHVKMIPSDLQAQFKFAGTNHTFRSSLTICMDCHGTDMGTQVQSGISDKVAALTDALSAIFQTKMLAAGFDTKAKARQDPTTGATLTDPADLTVTADAVRAIQMDPTGTRVIVTLTDGSQFRVALASVYNPNTTTKMFTVSATNTQIVAKAVFNLLFINNDGAKGIHNPAFANELLDNATAALAGVALP